MKPIIVYVDDAAYALPMIEKLIASAHGAESHWVLVACAPRITQRVSRWVSHSARENWRTKWADKLFAQLRPAFKANGSQITSIVAKVPLTELAEQLQAEHGSAQIIDVRRPKLSAAQHAPAPVASDSSQVLPNKRFSLSGTLAACAAMMGFVMEEVWL